MFQLRDPVNYEPGPESTLEYMANARGISPEEMALNLMLERDGHGVLYLPFLNYSQGSLEPIRAMMESPATLPGLSDGGAHVGMICDGSFPTSMLTHWTRDRTRGDRLPLEWVIHAQSRKTALAFGLGDRGLLQPGYKADLMTYLFGNIVLVDAAELRLLIGLDLVVVAEEE